MRLSSSKLTARNGGADGVDAIVVGVAARRGVDNDFDASRGVQLPEGGHPPGVTAHRGVDYDVGGSRPVYLPGREHAARRGGPGWRGIRS